MDDDTVPLRSRVARLRTICLRMGTLLAALVAVGATPAIAAAHGRHHHHGRQHQRRGFARSQVATVRTHRRRTRRHSEHDHVRRHTPSHARPRPQVVRAPTCVGAHARLGRISHTATESAVVCLLNVQRGHHGLPPVRGNPQLDDSAQGWTNEMVHDRAFSHGSDFGARISAVGFRWSRIGENIADGFRTPAGVVAAWMRSTGHCENILDPQFREVGAGFDTGTAESGTRQGTWTLDLALAERQRARSGDWAPAEGCPY
jgi:uncharacterized protein YkwD